MLLVTSYLRKPDQTKRVSFSHVITTLHSFVRKPVWTDVDTRRAQAGGGLGPSSSSHRRVEQGGHCCPRLVRESMWMEVQPVS